MTIQKLNVSPETRRALKAMYHDFGKDRAARAINALVGLRKEHADHTKRLVVTLLAPMCEDCWAYRFHRFEVEDSEWRHPDIGEKTWRADLRNYGATNADLRQIRHDQNEGAGPSCIRCGGTIHYGQEDVYVERVDFGEFLFGDPSDGGVPRKRASTFLRRALWLAYDRRCAGCDCALPYGKVTIDHILPGHAGGETRVENLQPMCEPCNTARKCGSLPQEVEVMFNYPLIPGGLMEHVQWGEGRK